jgi:hypothetical protein
MLLSSSTICYECDAVGTLKCNVCNRTYCHQHVQQHQRHLDEQIDWLTVEHDDLMQDLLQQISTPRYHPSMGVIDKWEEESIARIRHSAVLARRALIDAVDQHVYEVRKSLHRLTEKLSEARQDITSVHENNIQKWATILQDLKQIPVFLVTSDKNNSIYGLTIDVRKQHRTSHSKLNHDIPASRSLISIIRDPISPISTLITAGHQTAPINIIKKTKVDKKKVKFGSVPSNSPETITPGGVIIIREQQNDDTISPHIQQTDATIPIDS